jgi:mycoredoxin-dependent peroxiredoxin
MPVEVGERAPDLTLRDQDGQNITLSSVRDRQNVLLVFYPFAVSVDSPFALKSHAQSQRYEFPLLSDFWPHGEVARAYGVFNEISGMANR